MKTEANFNNNSFSTVLGSDPGPDSPDRDKEKVLALMEAAAEKSNGDSESENTSSQDHLEKKDIEDLTRFFEDFLKEKRKSYDIKYTCLRAIDADAPMPTPSEMLAGEIVVQKKTDNIIVFLLIDGVVVYKTSQYDPTLPGLFFDRELHTHVTSYIHQLPNAGESTETQGLIERIKYDYKFTVMYDVSLAFAIPGLWQSWKRENGARDILDDFVFKRLPKTATSQDLYHASQKMQLFQCYLEWKFGGENKWEERILEQGYILSQEAHWHVHVNPYYCTDNSTAFYSALRNARVTPEWKEIRAQDIYVKIPDSEEYTIKKSATINSFLNSFLQKIAFFDNDICELIKNDPIIFEFIEIASIPYVKLLKSILSMYGHLFTIENIKKEPGFDSAFYGIINPLSSRFQHYIEQMMFSPPRIPSLLMALEIYCDRLKEIITLAMTPRLIPLEVGITLVDTGESTFEEIIQILTCLPDPSAYSFVWIDTLQLCKENYALNLKDLDGSSTLGSLYEVYQQFLDDIRAMAKKFSLKISYNTIVAPALISAFQRRVWMAIIQADDLNSDLKKKLKNIQYYIPYIYNEVKRTGKGWEKPSELAVMSISVYDEPDRLNAGMSEFYLNKKIKCAIDYFNAVYESLPRFQSKQIDFFRVCVHIYLKAIIQRGAPGFFEIVMLVSYLYADLVNAKYSNLLSNSQAGLDILDEFLDDYRLKQFQKNLDSISDIANGNIKNPLSGNNNLDSPKDEFSRLVDEIYAQYVSRANTESLQFFLEDGEKLYGDTEDYAERTCFSSLYELKKLMWLTLSFSILDKNFSQGSSQKIEDKKENLAKLVSFIFLNSFVERGKKKEFLERHEFINSVQQSLSKHSWPIAKNSNKELIFFTPIFSRPFKKEKSLLDYIENESSFIEDKFDYMKDILNLLESRLKYIVEPEKRAENAVKVIEAVEVIDAVLTSFFVAYYFSSETDRHAEVWRSCCGQFKALIQKLKDKKSIEENVYDLCNSLYLNFSSIVITLDMNIFNFLKFYISCYQIKENFKKAMVSLNFVEATLKKNLGQEMSHDDAIFLSELFQFPNDFGENKTQKEKKITDFFKNYLSEFWMLRHVVVLLLETPFTCISLSSESVAAQILPLFSEQLSRYNQKKGCDKKISLVLVYPVSGEVYRCASVSFFGTISQHLSRESCTLLKQASVSFHNHQKESGTEYCLPFILEQLRDNTIGRPYKIGEQYIIGKGQFNYLFFQVLVWQLSEASAILAEYSLEPFATEDPAELVKCSIHYLIAFFLAQEMMRVFYHYYHEENCVISQAYMFTLHSSFMDKQKRPAFVKNLAEGEAGIKCIEDDMTSLIAMYGERHKIQDELDALKKDITKIKNDSDNKQWGQEQCVTLFSQRHKDRFNQLISSSTSSILKKVSNN